MTTHEGPINPGRLKDLQFEGSIQAPTVGRSPAAGSNRRGERFIGESSGPMQKWPRIERDVFELFIIQGFEPDEIAMITGQPLKKIQESITNIQSKLRDELLEQEVLA